MTIEFTITGRLWVDGLLVFERAVEDDPHTIYAFARDCWLGQQDGRWWEIELVPDEAYGSAEAMRWSSRDEPFVNSRLGFIPDVVHRFVELRHRVVLGEREEFDGD